MRPVDAFFLNHPEPIKDTLLFLREHILKIDTRITEAWKYGMPFYCYRDKMFCYLWVHKKYGEPYLGIVEGSLLNDPELRQEKRARMKILLLNPYEDIPLEKIGAILAQLLAHYQQKMG